MKFISTLAPAWVADHNPVYGGFFWINGDGSYPVPRSAYPCWVPAGRRQ